MAHGNVYPAHKIDAALSNYFRPGNLHALRELALLWVADQVDVALQRYRTEQRITDTWEARERVVVAVTGGPETETLVRRASRIAARAGAELVPQPFRPVIRGVLMTERASRFMRGEPGGGSRIAGHPLWWPPTKIAGRELAAYLQGIDEAHRKVRGLPVDLKVGRSDTDEIEVLSLH
jgi:hypothetical protein